MRAELIVELTFGTESAGTGYLLTPRHVLTARHVAEPECLDAPCTVQPLVEYGYSSTQKRRPRSVEGRVAWLSQDYDLGIVTLQQSYSPEAFSHPLRLGAIADNDISPRSFLSAGFPLAAGKGNKTIQGSLTFEPVSQYFNLEIGYALPRNYRKWAGLSGAPVFCGEFLVGVVRTVDPNWDRLLTATPVRFMVEDSDFNAYWTTQGVPALPMAVASRMERTLLEGISAHTYLIDRADPREQVKGYVRGLRNRAGSQVVAIPGLDDDEHQYLIRQLSEDPEMQRLLGREAKSVNVIVPLPWPAETEQIDPDVRFRLITDKLCAVANVMAPGPGTSINPVALRASFDSGTTPRAFWLLVRRKIAYGGHSQLLQRTLDLWASLGEGLPVLLFLCLAWDEPHEKRRTLLASLFSNPPQPEIELEEELRSGLNKLPGRSFGINELEPINTGHVDPWIAELAYRCAPLSSERLDGLRMILLHCIGTGKRARQIAAALGPLLLKM